MVTKIKSCGILGLEASLIDIEVHIQKGLPGINIIGLPDLSVKEAKDRVRSAIIHAGYAFPIKKITVSLAPANMKKIGSLFDLPIAIGILIASGQFRASNHNDYIIAGELSLNNDAKPVNGALLITKKAKELGFSSVIVPDNNKEEASFIRDINIYPVKTLLEAIAILQGKKENKHFHVDIESVFKPDERIELDFSDVKGQYQAKRGLELACAGNHNVLMIGPPGCGKTMMARRLPSIMPTLTLQEAIETTEIYSISGNIPAGEFIVQKRPFRDPHHTSSDISIIGGGRYPNPGEVSLSHNGILFLDELTEFKKNVLQVLRQPLEEERVSISRAEYSVIFPSRFMLVATMNPCPCGYLTDPDIECRCTPIQRRYYFSKVSGPLFDRIDIQLKLNKVKVTELANNNYKEETSSTKRERIMLARERQNNRFKLDNIYSNSQMNRKQIDKYCKLNSALIAILRQAVTSMNLSARAYDKLIKLSRTVADLDDREEIKELDIMEALEYRQAERLINI